MTDDIETLYNYITAGIQVFLGFYFFRRFLHRKIKPYLYLLFGGCTVTAICLIPGATIVRLGIFILMLAVAGIFVCRADWKTAVLYAVLTEAIMQLCYGIVKSLLSILYPHLLGFERNAVVFSFMLAGEGAAMILTVFCYCLVQRHFSDEMYSFHCNAMEKQYILPAFIPILMIFFMDEYINSFIYGMVVVDEYGTEIDLYTNHYQMLTIQLLSMGSLFCVLFTYKRLLQSFRLSTELSLLEQQERSLNQYVEEAKARYDGTRSFRHDIRNHISVVKGLLQGGKVKEAVSYMEDMDDMAEKMSFPCSTNNPVVDILVGNKLGVARSMGMDVECSLLLPYPCGLRDIDICIVLSNALDNAICACRNVETGAESYIRVSGRIQGDFLMMEVENSYRGSGAVQMGTGLSNVKTVVEKYDGAMSTETRGDAFVLHVLLIIPQQEEDISRQNSEPGVFSVRKSK